MADSYPFDFVYSRALSARGTIGVATRLPLWRRLARAVAIVLGGSAAGVLFGIAGSEDGFAPFANADRAKELVGAIASDRGTLISFGALVLIAFGWPWIMGALAYALFSRAPFAGKRFVGAIDADGYQCAADGVETKLSWTAAQDAIVRNRCLLVFISRNRAVFFPVEGFASAEAFAGAVALAKAGVRKRPAS